MCYEAVIITSTEDTLLILNQWDETPCMDVLIKHDLSSFCQLGASSSECRMVVLAVQCMQWPITMNILSF